MNDKQLTKKIEEILEDCTYDDWGLDDGTQGATSALNSGKAEVKLLSLMKEYALREKAEFLKRHIKITDEYADKLEKILRKMENIK